MIFAYSRMGEVIFTLACGPGEMEENKQKTHLGDQTNKSKTKWNAIFGSFKVHNKCHCYFHRSDPLSNLHSPLLLSLLGSITQASGLIVFISHIKNQKLREDKSPAPERKWQNGEKQTRDKDHHFFLVLLVPSWGSLTSLHLKLCAVCRWGGWKWPIALGNSMLQRLQHKEVGVGKWKDCIWGNPTITDQLPNNRCFPGGGKWPFFNSYQSLKSRQTAEGAEWNAPGLEWSQRKRHFTPETLMDQELI